MASYALHAGTRIVQVFDPNVTPVVRLRRVDAGANDFDGKYLTFDSSGNGVFVAAPAATIADNAVTNAKLADVATSTIKGRATGGSGDPEDLTANQVSTILDSATDPFIRTSAGGSGITELTGDVTAGPGSGSQAATVANSAITNAKMANMATDTFKGRANASGTGAPVDLTATQARAILNVADGANAYVHPNHSGDVTSSGDGATTIANSAVTYAKIQNVSATDKLLGRSTAGAGVVEEIACTAAGRNLLDDADATAQRTTLGLGTMATQAASSVSISGGSVTGITDLAVADGGTGASNAPTARTNLGLGTLATQSGTFTDKVTGPGSATDNAVARFDGTGGKTVKNSGVIIDNSNNVTGVAGLTAATASIAGGFGSSGLSIDASGNVLTDGSITSAGAIATLGALAASGNVTVGAAAILGGCLRPTSRSATIASGVVALPASGATLFVVDTEGAAATDNLDSITGGTANDILFLKTANSGRDVTIVHAVATDKFILSGGVNFTLTTISSTICFIYYAGVWRELFRITL
jgi:hypothetical protein